MSARKRALKQTNNKDTHIPSKDNDMGTRHPFSTKNGGGAMDNNTAPLRPRGVIQILANHFQQQNATLVNYEFDASLFQETQRTLLLRRRRKRTFSRRRPSNQDAGTSESTDFLYQATPQERPLSFFDVLQQRDHRFVCFLVVQYAANALCHSQHSLAIRKLLALAYQDLLTTVVIMVGRPAQGQAQETSALLTRSGDSLDEEGGAGGISDVLDDNIFCHGTGFSLLCMDHTSVLLSMLNVTQVPSVVVLDTVTGRQLGDTALLAMEHHANNPHQVIQAWEQGKSGLSCCSKFLAMVTCQTSTPCVIQ
jgi:hypothetical protein